MRNKSTIQPGETLKWCSKCQTEKPLEDFSKNRSRPDGLQNYCKGCAYGAHRDSFLKHKGKNFENHRRWTKNRNLKQVYGITLEEFDLMVLEQNNRCPICRLEMTPPHVDHDHTTKAIRSLLCGTCNVGLGMFKEDTELLLRAVSYLDSYTRSRSSRPL